jgi:site-specific recombinase XerD
MGSQTTKLETVTLSSHEIELALVEKQIEEILEKLYAYKRDLEALKASANTKEISRIRGFCKLTMDEFIQKRNLLQALNLPGEFNERRSRLIEIMEISIQQMAAIHNELRDYRRNTTSIS